MTNKIFSFLKNQNISAPDLVDTLIISAYIKFNKIAVKKNQLIRSHILKSEDTTLLQVFEEFTTLIEEEVSKFNYEALIQLFEFVISPADKITNGAVYTPEFIRRYIVTNTLSLVEKNRTEIKACDVSCGCGGFLLTLTEQIKKETNLSYKAIYKNNIYGLDITSYSIERAKLLLSIFAIQNGEDENFHFNLVVDNALTYQWQKGFKEVKVNNGFDVIVGNPPYVTSRNMDDETKELVSQWSVSASGHPDMYIPFFEIGFSNLSPHGTLGYITVNTFIKSLNGRALREYFETERINLKIINFGGEQIFKGQNTYTCICFLSHNGDQIHYIKTESSQLNNIRNTDFNKYSYQSLNIKDGWNLVNTEELKRFIAKVESTGTPFTQLYTTRNGIATLKNDVYKFDPIRSNRRYYYFMDGKKEIAIERNICKDIVNANKIKSREDLTTLREKVIFPYFSENEKLLLISEEYFIEHYPRAYAYLSSKRELLDQRDKGKVDDYEAWYAYGRRQSMEINAYKLFFPHICERPKFVLCRERELLFYNGIAVISDRLRDLRVLKKLLESNLFFEYIRNTTKDYTSGYISLSKNYIKNFGVPELSNDISRQLLTTEDIDRLLGDIYDTTYHIETT